MARKVVKKNHVIFYVYIRKVQHKAIQKIARDKDTTLSALMRDVIDDYLKNQKTDVLELNDSHLAR